MYGQVLIEWCISLLYLLTAILSLHRSRYAQRTSELDLEKWFWQLLAGMLVFFGINKIADLQTVLLTSLKSLALSLDLAHAKQSLKLALAAAIVGLSLCSAGWLIWRFRNVLARYPLALLGLTCLAGYYLVRAADFLGFALSNSLASQTWILEAVGLVILLAVAGRLRLKMGRPRGA
jgi:hypothetical protein